MEMKKKKRFLVVIVVLVLPIVFSWMNCRGGMKKLGQVSPILTNNALSFKIDYGNTNGLLSVTITDISVHKVVWDINLAYFCSANLNYGEVPQEFETFNGAVNSARQRFPETGSPLDLVEGKVYSMYTDWQYDYFITAAVESTTQYFKIENKQIVFVEDPNTK